MLSPGIKNRRSWVAVAGAVSVSLSSIAICCISSINTPQSQRTRRMSATIDGPGIFKPVSRVILDLDGTLLDTERIVDEVNRTLFSKFGKVWNSNGLEKRLGKLALESSQILVQDYGLPCTAEEFLALTAPMYEERWAMARPLPGANRVIKHLRAHKIPIALASNSAKANILSKLKHQPGWRDAFTVVIGSDEVKQGKPAPEIYIEAAKMLGAEPENCLVIEDSPSGVAAGKAAGMQVVAIPSLPKKDDRARYLAADCILSSLLDLKPEKWGLPCFEDWVCCALPIEPWHVGGQVIKGFGRGSKVLGIPTANLPTAAFSSILADQVCGIYLGWASLSNRGVFKMVMSVGWNPYFDNSEKTVEPWLLHEFPEDFYGEELRLVVAGYIRPEANFPSLEALVDRIHEDGRIAKAALDVPPYSDHQHDPFLTTGQIESYESV